MKLKETLIGLRKKFKLDSHHTIERFGIFVGVFAVVGALVFSASGASAFRAGRADLASLALYTPTFTTSKTQLPGDVDGVYVSRERDRALVVMHFEPDAQISYSAEDYEAFLLGSSEDLSVKPVKTPGITGSVYVFGSTGYLGLLLDAEQPFSRQILNITMRANQELTYAAEDTADVATEDGTTPTEQATTDAGTEDESFSKFDQWEIFVNPAASEAEEIPALDSIAFDPAKAFYDVVLHQRENTARTALDNKLGEMRADLSQISTYTEDLEKTKVDGVGIMKPEEPGYLAGDQITGQSAEEADSGESTLALKSEHVVPGGTDIPWRAGNVYDGYFDELLAPGQTTSQYFAKKAEEEQNSSSASSDLSTMSWKLTDGSDLTQDYATSDVTMRPLVNVMNNLSTAYGNYGTHKTEYETTLMADLLAVESDMRDVKANSSTRTGEDVLTVYY